MTSIKMPFGLNDHNKIVHITEVEQGKKCNCTCPGCGSLLIARKGDKNQHHFQHTTADACTGGFESAIHLAAKQIIKERKQITLPKHVITLSKRDSRGKEHTESAVVGKDGEAIYFDSVQDEVKLPSIKVDLLAEKNSKSLIIEIFYRHKVDNEKILKIASSKTSAVEINLSNLASEDLKNWETFWFHINNPQRVRWLYNTKTSALYAEIEKKLEEKIQEQEKKYQEQAKREAMLLLNPLPLPNELPLNELSLSSIKGSNNSQHLKPSNQPILLNRTILRRSPPPIDRIRGNHVKFRRA